MKSILIVDDEIQIIELFDELLGGDYRLHYAQTGNKAIEVFRQKDSNLIITDVSMPVFDGLQLITEVRKISQVPVLAVSGADTVKLQQAVELGANATLLKPFRISIVIETVRRLLED